MKEEDNLRTNKTQSSGGSLGDWMEKTDKTSGRVFYYNTKTKKTQWTKPVESSLPMDSVSNAAIRTNGTDTSPTTGAVATGKDKTEHPTTKVSADEGSSSNWKEMTDKKSGRIFYYNKVTKKTQWTKPDEDSSAESSSGSLTSKKLPTKKDEETLHCDSKHE